MTLYNSPAIVALQENYGIILVAYELVYLLRDLLLQHTDQGWSQAQLRE